MATADQYAEWIVKNADKRGTPEFATVVQAYEMAKSEESQAGIGEQLAPTPQAPGLGAQLIGAGETALTLGTGATGGLAGMLGGTAKGLVQSILDGSFGTQDAVRMIEKAAAESAQALTYAPRTPVGQEMVQATGEVMQQVLPVVPLTGELIMATQAARGAAPAVSTAADIAAQRTQQAARAGGQAVAAPIVAGISRGREMMGLSPLESQAIAGRPVAPVAAAGAEATPQALLRARTAEGLPTPVELTLGAERRDPAQLAFEKEAMKRPDEMGQMLRDRAEANNAQILQNFEKLAERTGAEAVDPIATGNKVQDALIKDWNQAKTDTRAAYKAALASQEANSEVLASTKVVIGSGDDQIAASLLDYVNERAKGVDPAVANSAKAQLIRFGIAEEGPDGQLVAKRATVKQFEDLRQEVVGAADQTKPRQLRDETIIKKLIDATTDPVAGPLFKKARALRTNQANKFENRAVVSRLVTDVRGMKDPRVAADQVFNKSILAASPGEITHLKRVLNLSDDGRQAWKELQGATMRHITDEATKGLGTDSMGRPLVSPAKLNQVVSTLDKNGRLDLVLGKKSAEIVRDLNDVSKYISTTPPGTLINNSGTAGTLMAAMADIGISGTLIGAPVPLVTGLKALATHMKNKEMRAKVIKALNTKAPTGTF